MKNNQRRQRETHRDRGGVTVGQEGREEETVIHGDRQEETVIQYLESETVTSG